MPKIEISYDDTYLQSLEATDIPDTESAFDPDADYNRPMPPIPDGIYQAILTNSGVYADGKKVPYRSAQWANETKPHFEIAVQATLISDQPILNGRFVYTGMPLTTRPDPERQNASAVSAAYRAITGKPIAGLPGLSHVKQLDEVLQGSPVGWIQVQNELHDTDAEKNFSDRKKIGDLRPGEKRPKAVYGQKKIAALKGGSDSQGRFTGAADHPETGNRCAAKAVISAFKPSPS